MYVIGRGWGVASPAETWIFLCPSAAQGDGGTAHSQFKEKEGDQTCEGSIRS